MKKHDACPAGARWALSISEDMADVWNALIKEEKHEGLIWTATRPGVFPDTVLRKLAYRFIRETPLSDGRKVWDLLGDERSRRAVEAAERFSDGKATETEMAAYDAAHAGYTAAYAAATAAYDAALDADAAARAAAYDAALDAARASQIKMIAEMGNPFKEE